jgi:hypothetical protein
MSPDRTQQIKHNIKSHKYTTELFSFFKSQISEVTSITNPMSQDLKQ